MKIEMRTLLVVYLVAFLAVVPGCSTVVDSKKTVGKFIGSEKQKLGSATSYEIQQSNNPDGLSVKIFENTFYNYQTIDKYNTMEINKVEKTRSSVFMAIFFIVITLGILQPVFDHILVGKTETEYTDEIIIAKGELFKEKSSVKCAADPVQATAQIASTGSAYSDESDRWN